MHLVKINVDFFILDHLSDKKQGINDYNAFIKAFKDETVIA